MYEDKTALARLNGVGPQLAEKFKRIGLHNVADLVFHLPLRYEDKTKVTPITYLKSGDAGLILAQVDAAEVKFGRRRSLWVSVSDGTGQMVLRFFYFNKRQQIAFKPGAWIRCFGDIRLGPHSLEIVHPEYKIFQKKPISITEQSLSAIYPSTEGMNPATIRKWVNQALTLYKRTSRHILPEKLEKEFGLMSLFDALTIVHHPPANADTSALLAGTHPAQTRLALEELLAHHLALTQLRVKRNLEQAPVFDTIGHSWQKLKASLSFELTQAQNKVIREIFVDIGQPTPSLRLIQGDVGSGKTVVGAAAALCAIDNGYQAVLMAPTELLAEQHLTNFSTWLEPLNISLVWLTGKLKAKQKKQALDNIASGQAKMIIGTHALFQDQVVFQKLGIMIIDEQHRFGVDQRLALRKKGNLGTTVPHQLIMSATPIPRSLAMIFYADLDVSSIDQLPPGRKPVTTVVVPDNRRQEVAKKTIEKHKAGEQVYWVCPLIDESEKLQAQAATETVENLVELLPMMNIALIHGRLKSSQKEEIMKRFNMGEIDLLVATTVIEVGVDVPNATLMVIENAERLGLAQIHQLRGRVGRGGKQSTCVLLYQAPLSDNAKTRLAILRQTSDGFLIAQKDLEQRGPGELLGTRQAGLQQLKIANLSRDKGLFPKVERLAQVIIRQHPECITLLINRWIRDSQQYANV